MLDINAIHLSLYKTHKCPSAFEPMGICVSYDFVDNSVSISISPSVDLCINRAGAKRRGSNHAIVTALPRNISVRVLFDELELDFRSCRNTDREEPFGIIGIQQRFCAFILVPTTQLRHITYNVNVFTVAGFSFYMENDLVLVTRQDIIGKRIADSIPFRNRNVIVPCNCIVRTCTIRSFDGYILIRHWSDTAIHRKLKFHLIMYYSITLSAFGTGFGT